MISTLKKKLNKKGFTLAELLIVVAIIAILAAIAILVFSNQLTNAKVATDIANLRSAKSVAQTMYLTDDGKAISGYYQADGTIGNGTNYVLTKAGYQAGSEEQDKIIAALTSSSYSAGQRIKVDVAADTGPVTVTVVAVGG